MLYYYNNTKQIAAAIPGDITVKQGKTATEVAEHDVGEQTPAFACGSGSPMLHQTDEAPMRAPFSFGGTG